VVETLARRMSNGRKWNVRPKKPGGCNKFFTRRPSKSQLGSISETVSAHCCVLGPDGKILTEGRLRSTTEAMARHFKIFRLRASHEVGTHSRWVSQLLGQWGHEVIVANPRNSSNDRRQHSQVGPSPMRTCSPGSHVSIRNCSLRSCIGNRESTLTSSS